MKKTIILFCFLCSFGLTTSAQDQWFGVLLAESDAFYDSAKYVEAYQRYLAMTWTFNNPDEKVILNKRIEQTRDSIGKLFERLNKEIDTEIKLQRDYESSCVKYAIFKERNRLETIGKNPFDSKDSLELIELDLRDFDLKLLPIELTKFKSTLLNLKLDGNYFEDSIQVYSVLKELTMIDPEIIKPLFDEAYDRKFESDLAEKEKKLRKLTQDSTKVPNKYYEKDSAFQMFEKGKYIEALQFYDLIIDDNPINKQTLIPLQQIVIETIKLTNNNLRSAKERIIKIRENTNIITFDRAVLAEYDFILSCKYMTNSREYDFIEKLSFCNFNLVELPDKISLCKNLKYLNLIGNESINWEKAFALIPEKTKVYASINDIIRIPSKYRNRIVGIRSADLLGDLKNGLVSKDKLEYLEVESSRIDQTTFKEILKIGTLKQLTITKANIRSLPDDIGDLKNLKVLNLAGNKIDKLPERFGQLTNLEELNLENNILEEIPKQLANLPNLKTLKLSGNSIVSVTDGKLQTANLNEKIENLYLDDNAIKQLVIDINNLKNLKHLDLSGNKITELPDNFGQLSNIASLDMRDNNFEVFPDEILKLSKLEKLDLSRNSISSIPPGISNMSALKHLDLLFNKISTLPPEFKNLTKLKYLDLASNQIRYLQDSPIWKLGSLETLILKRNQIKTIPEDFKKMKNLKILDLSENPLDNNTKAKLEKFRKEGLTIHL
jgi:Leucine-rich repeat (LRR) protein